jgi:hypothetical protein
MLRLWLGSWLFLASSIAVGAAEKSDKQPLKAVGSALMDEDSRLAMENEEETVCIKRFQPGSLLQRWDCRPRNQHDLAGDKQDKQRQPAH